MLIDKLGSRIYNEALFPEPGDYDLDPVHTFAEFAAQHFVVGRVRGCFTDISGMLHIAEDPLKSSAEFTIKTASITTNHPARDEDLRSERFFNVANYPLMIFKSSAFIPEFGGKWTTTGDMTILGNTRPISFRVTFGGIVKDLWGNTRLALAG